MLVPPPDLTQRKDRVSTAFKGISDAAPRIQYALLGANAIYYGQLTESGEPRDECVIDRKTKAITT
jgi:hypothetical protein